MTDAQIATMLRLIHEYVDDTSKPWREKRDYIMDNLAEDGVTALEEFVSWFERAEK